MKIVFLFILFFGLICCAPHSNITVKSTNPESTKVESTRKKLSKEKLDSIHADIDKRLSSYNDWWNRIYKSDSLLYQRMMECVYPSESRQLVSVGPSSENVVTDVFVGLSKDNKSHISYSDKSNKVRLDSLRKKEPGKMWIYQTDFAFVFEKDLLIGVRPQWDENRNPEFEKYLSNCAVKYGINVLEGISNAEFTQNEFERFYGGKGDN